MLSLGYGAAYAAGQALCDAEDDDALGARQFHAAWPGSTPTEDRAVLTSKK